MLFIWWRPTIPALVTATLLTRPGSGEQPQPEPFGFPGAGGAVQGEHRHPGGQLARHGHQLAPDLVLGEAVQRQVAQAGVLGVADAVFAPGAAPVP
jgi:hypothetical protein